MKEIEIGFACLPNNFQQKNNFIYNTLSKKYKVKLTDKPEFLFYSRFAGEQPKSRVRVFFTGENRRVDMTDCDWAFGFDYEDQVGHYQYMRLPLYVLHAAGLRDFWHELPTRLKKPLDHQLEAQFATFQQREFCVYIAANETLLRAQVFDLINRYRTITAPGKSKNNAAPIESGTAWDSRLNPDWQQAKIEYMKQFRFALVFENSSYPGYTTEKLVDAMIAGCIPIYWGNPEINREFNPDSFYDLTPYISRSESRLPNQIKSGVDRFSRKLMHLTKKSGLKRGVRDFIASQSDTDQLFHKFQQPWLSQQQLDQWFDFSKYENRLFEIIES